MPEKSYKEDAYKAAGVDIEAGNALVRKIKDTVKSTHRPGVLTDIGGFGALFGLKESGDWQDPVLVSATDGVGTKLKIAFACNIHNTVGIDLVAMCANDLIVQGAQPLFFLDYFATGKLETGVAAQVIEGIAEGCRQAECALIGGETAEMPGMYADGHYDLAGFCVGAVERQKIIDGSQIQPGDSVLALPSSGLHSNGFSLVRKIVEDQGLSYDQKPPFNSEFKTLGEALLTPTSIYHKALKEPISKSLIKGLAHITGGGLFENIPRILPEGCTVSLDGQGWNVPAVMSWLAERADLSQKDMLTTFNCGIGMVFVCAAQDKDALIQSFTDAGEAVLEIGEVVSGQGFEIKNFQAQSL